MKRLIILMFVLIFSLSLIGCGHQAKNKYSLSITKTGEGMVEPTEGTHQYVEGTVVTLLPTADIANGWYFKGWGGPNGNEVSEENKILMNQDKAITAIFDNGGILDVQMQYVPGADSFPILNDDSKTCTTVDYPYLIGETEVTYKQWITVYNWAVENGYSFENPGSMGDGTADTEDHPVTMINWRDAMVGCNALTEYYNMQNGSNLSCVYSNNGEVVRNSTDVYSPVCDNVDVDPGANGFRLPTTMEWELAARYRGSDPTNAVEEPAGSGKYWTRGNSASGATADYTDTDATEAVAWYDGNSGNSTNPVATNSPNELGLYDMSGNVYEFCFDWHKFYIGTHRIIRGGGWKTKAELLQISLVNIIMPETIDYELGFRLVRTTFDR